MFPIGTHRIRGNGILHPMKGDPEFGRRLKGAREALGLKQMEAAVGIGISRSHLANIERGNKGAGRQNMLKIKDFYKISLDDFLAASEGGLIKGASNTHGAIEGAIVSMVRKLTPEQATAVAQMLMALIQPKNGTN